MFPRTRLPILPFLLALVVTPTAAASDQAATIEESEGVVREIMAIPAKRIPAELLSNSHGVAIIPNVIKIGFIAGVRRGHGVLLVKDKDGDWNLPQFITLTGGSIGWQAGAQATDVILVFKTAKSVNNISNGKVTIGAELSAAAGPVGRNASAATDAQLKAEILSYSRSRGLFAGVSLDGSSIELDAQQGRELYGDELHVKPIPACAVRLMGTIANLAGDAKHLPPIAIGNPGGDVGRIRKELAQSAQSLNALLSPDWQRYLALPPVIYGQGDHPPLDALNACRQNFERVNNNAAYAQLRARPEFQTTLELLRDYIAVCSRPDVLRLPPPPPNP